MESTGKIITWIVVGLLVIAGAYYWYTNRAVAPTQQPSTQTQTPAKPVSLLPTGTNTSDEALTQDAAAITGLMSTMNGDTAAIDAGLSDKQVVQ